MDVEEVKEPRRVVKLKGIHGLRKYIRLDDEGKVILGLAGKSDWEKAVQEGRLEQSTSAVYELVSGINELGDDDVKRIL